MADINEKYVIYYAVRDYSSGQTVTISVYDTAGTAEVSDQSMTELGSTGIYYYNFYPRKRTSYLAIMDCPAKPHKAHKVMRIEKQKVSGAVTIPRVKVSPTWSQEEKNNLLKSVKNLQKDRTGEIIASVRELQGSHRVDASNLSQEIKKLEIDRSELIDTIKKYRAEMNDESTTFRELFFKETNDLREALVDITGKTHESLLTEFAKLSKNLILNKLDVLKATATHLSDVSRDILVNAKEISKTGILSRMDNLQDSCNELIRHSDDMGQILRLNRS